MVNIDEITGTIALQCTLAKMDGYQVDKKVMRYSNMADYVDHVLSCGENMLDCDRRLIYEAVVMCIKGNAMYTGELFNRSAWQWMEM